MKKKDPQIDRLGDVLDQSLKRLELASRLDEYSVWPVWNGVVGQPIARNAQPEKIRNGTLFVKVTSPVWMQQLQFMKDLITEKLNQRLGSQIVKNIFFVVGKIDAEPAEAEPPSSSVQPPTPACNDHFLDSVTDPEIRQAFKRLLNSYTRRKYRS